MNINLIYPLIPAAIDRHIPGTTITACQLLNALAEQIKQQLQQSTKDTPFARITIMAEYIEDLIRKLKRQVRTQPASANLNIIIQFGASAQDDRWHTTCGFTVTSQPANPQSNQLADLLIRQAQQILDRQAITNQTSPTSQRQHSTARLLDIATAPTVLTTCLYIDNRHNADFLRSHEGISSLATVHAAAIKQYLKLIQ